ncbi:FMRFamide receptor [Eurytemora carolleeae]|uniref:FMRFamide receptor n=1 Tax=Eurytemora carolleeae TaxID=1294199 RepID=UPI000C767782|nr:FMRFamide receptor [Eurytemora carolleeae]|eukprot:XP_023340807.1 FMRFamide receptor-like [Eurytemora affinis]
MDKMSKQFTNQSINLTSNHHQDIISDSLFEFWVPGVLLNIVGILGLIGNFITIIILSRPSMKSSLNFILLGLASFDTVLIFTSVLMFGIPGIQTLEVINRNKGMFSSFVEDDYPIIMPYIYPAVCHPLKAKVICTYRRSKIAVAIIALVSILYNMPRYWEVTSQKIKAEDKYRLRST